MTKLMTAFALALVLGLGLTGTVSADTSATQNQSLEQEIECKAEGYGQTKCYAKQKGEQSQKITTRDGVKIHKVINTGLDTPVMTLALGTLTAGAAAAFVKFKQQV